MAIHVKLSIWETVLDVIDSGPNVHYRKRGLLQIHLSLLHTSQTLILVMEPLGIGVSKEPMKRKPFCESPSFYGEW